MVVLQHQRLNLVSLEGQFFNTQAAHLGARDHQGQVVQAQQRARGEDEVAIFVHCLNELIDKATDRLAFTDQVVVIQNNDKVFPDVLVGIVDNNPHQTVQIEMG